MKSILLALLVTIVLISLLLAVIATGRLPLGPDTILLIALPAALCTLAIIGWIQRWGRARLLLSILVGPLLLLVLRVLVVAVDRWLQPLVHPNRLPWAIALDLSGILLSFFAVTCLWVWLLRKLDRARNGSVGSA